MSNFNWGIVVWMVIVGLVCGTIGYIIAPEETTGLSSAEINAKISDAVEQAIAGKDTEIERLMGLLEKTEEEENGEEIIVFEGYLLSDLFLSQPFVEEIFSDREVETLFDGKIDFDGKDYDAEETLVLKNITLLANGIDFEGNVYMTLLEGAIEYKLEFENDLNTGLINDEDTLEFGFLGESYEVSKWDGTTITLTKGMEYSLKPEESITIDEKVVLLKYVTDDAIYIEVDGIGRSIDENKTRTINGLEIKVRDVFSSESYSVAILVIGEEIEAEIVHDEEYTEDSPWKWVIGPNSIGLVLAEDFTEVDLDGDEEFPAVGVNEKLCLPNEYMCVQFNGMVEEDTEEYTLKPYEKSGKTYVRMGGNFQNGTKDYNRIYVNDTGIYDRYFKLINSDVIELGDTDSILNRTADWIIMEDFKVNYYLNNSETENIKKVWDSLNSKDEDWLTDYGILVINPEDSIEDQEFDVFVPEKKLEGSISILGWETIKEAEDIAEETINQTNT